MSTILLNSRDTQSALPLIGILDSDGQLIGELAAAYDTQGVHAETFDGEYVVTPKVMAQTMPTKQKMMRDDVTIREIPFFETSNTSGGNTVYIGSEV